MSRRPLLRASLWRLQVAIKRAWWRGPGAQFQELANHIDHWAVLKLHRALSLLGPSCWYLGHLPRLDKMEHRGKNLFGFCQICDAFLYYCPGEGWRRSPDGDEDKDEGGAL